MSRFIDEDINRLWDEPVLNGPRHSVELRRAREIRPLIDQADVILDLHSMLWPSDPLILCGPTPEGKALGQAMGWPPTVVADAGHANGPRLIDYARFAGPGATAVLVEAGQHWRPETVDTTMASVSGLLRHFELVNPDALLPPPSLKRSTQFAVVTDVVTPRTSSFSFVRAWYGGEIVAKTKYGDCYRRPYGNQDPIRQLPSCHAQSSARKGSHGGPFGQIRDLIAT